MAELHDPYEDQLSAARFKAERDQARQEVERLRKELDARPVETMSAYDLLPEKERRILEMWPRWEDTGEPVMPGECESIEVYEQTITVWFGGYHEHLDPGGTIKRSDPEVLAADRKPLKIGETVWHVNSGEEAVVKGLYPGRDAIDVEYDESDVMTKHTAYIGAECFTHEPPVFAADGKPLHKGETVYHTSGKHGPLKVVGFDTDVSEHPLAVVESESEGRSKCRPQRLSHENPDSWERWREDMLKDVCRYFNDGRVPNCEECRFDSLASFGDCEQEKARDLEHRAKALSERGAE